jgi:ribonuclease-3
MPASPPLSTSTAVAVADVITPLQQQQKVCNPWNPKNKIIPDRVIRSILETYGVKRRFPDLTLFKQACVHTSYVDKSDIWAKQEEPMILADRPTSCLPLQAADNEELEYAGDGILSGVVATYLKERFSGQGEGFMTNLRTEIVNNDRLGELAKKVGFAPWLMISRHVEEVCDGRQNLRLLGSMFEAWLGALYYSAGKGGKGFEEVQTFVVNVMERHIYFVELITKNTNYKDQLLRWFQAEYHEPPRYKVVKEEGPSHDRIFTMGVLYPTLLSSTLGAALSPEEGVIATAKARNKKEAEQTASRIALDVLTRQKAAAAAGSAAVK